MSADGNTMAIRGNAVVSFSVQTAMATAIWQVSATKENNGGGVSSPLKRRGFHADILMKQAFSQHICLQGKIEISVSPQPMWGIHAINEMKAKYKFLLLKLTCALFLSSLLTGCGFFNSSPKFNPQGDAVAKTAYNQLGSKYARGGTSPRKGFDCSGFIYWVYRKNGYKDIPRVSTEQAKYGVCVAKTELQAGDILVSKS